MPFLQPEWDKNSEAIQSEGMCELLERMEKQWFVASVTVREDMQWRHQATASWGLIHKRHVFRIFIVVPSPPTKET